MEVGRCFDTIATESLANELAAELGLWAPVADEEMGRIEKRHVQARDPVPPDATGDATPWVGKGDGLIGIANSDEVVVRLVLSRNRYDQLDFDVPRQEVDRGIRRRDRSGRQTTSPSVACPCQSLAVAVQLRA